MPLLDVSMDNGDNENTTRNIAYTLFKSITNINLDELNNPKTYLESEIPLLGLFDVVTFSGTVNGTSSSTGSSQNGTVLNPDKTDNNNPENVPVVKTNLDYSKPAVIIFHTHTIESYTPSSKYNYEIVGDYQTTDNNYNVCRLGQEIKNYLETNYGAVVIHDITVHDLPSRNGSYNRAKPTIESLLKKYPDVKLIIDLHRDAVNDVVKDKDTVTAAIGGEQVAKIMFVIGVTHFAATSVMADHFVAFLTLFIKMSSKITSSLEHCH
jgi:stage II sporulation protein P